MRFNTIKTLLLAALLMLPAGASFADSGSHTVPLYKDSNGKRQVVDTNGSLLVSGGTLSTRSAIIDPSGNAFATTTTGNPLMQMTVQQIPVASVNASGGYALISGVTGRRVYPAGLTVMASGTAASATRLMVVCSGGNVIASIPIAHLVDRIAVTPFASVLGTYTLTSTGFARGCASGESVLVSNVGSNMTTTTDIFVNMPYSMQ